MIVSYQTGATVGRRICGCDKTKVGAPSEEKSKLFLATGNPPVTQKGRRLQMFVYTTGRRKEIRTCTSLRAAPQERVSEPEMVSSSVKPVENRNAVI